jgi:hypothetical protein
MASMIVFMPPVRWLSGSAAMAAAASSSREAGSFSYNNSN